MEKSSIMIFAAFFSKAVSEVISKATGVKVEPSKTVQIIPNVKIAGSIGSFVNFQGDYNGIMIMNFSGESAIEIVGSYLRFMGLPEDDIPVNHTSDDVRNNIGEIINQIIGKFRNLIEKRYDLAAKANIPAVIPISSPIGLLLESPHPEDQDCVRISFSTPSSKRFHVEVSMEPIKLVELNTH